MDIRQELFALQDETYRAFQTKLMPTVDADTVIGVRTPALRRLAKALAKTPQAAAFMTALPHGYYEENNLHAFLIEKLRDYDATVAALDAFLPYVDNWATCDMMSPKVLGTQLGRTHEKALEWMRSPHPFTVRFGVETLMRFFLDDAFDTADLCAVASLPAQDYYVHMMIAWYFATALAKQYTATLPFLEQPTLAARTHAQTIQKAIDSRRLTASQKAYLRTLRRLET